MAYPVKSTAQTYNGTTSTNTHVLSDSIDPNNEIDDIIVLAGSVDLSRTVSASGFTSAINNTSSNHTLYVLWRRATAANEAIPDLTLNISDTATCTYFIVRGCPTGSSPIGNSSINAPGGSVIERAFNSISYSANSTLMFLATADRRGIARMSAQVIPLSAIDSNGDASAVGVEFYDEAGTSYTNMKAYASESNSDDMKTYVLEFLDDGTGVRPDAYPKTSPALNMDININEDNDNTVRDALRLADIDPLTGASMYTVTFDAATDVTAASTDINIPGHLFTDAEVVYLDQGVGTIPTPLIDAQYYSVNVIDVNTIRLRDANESADYFAFNSDITISAVGSGTMTLTRVNLYRTSIDNSGEISRPGNGYASGNVPIEAHYSLGSSFDFTNYNLVGYASTLNLSWAEIIALDSSGELSVHRFAGAGQQLVSGFFQIDLSKTPRYQSGSFDITDVTKIGFIQKRPSVSSRSDNLIWQWYRTFAVQKKINIMGDNVNAQTIFNAIRDYDDGLASSSLDSSFLYEFSIEFGNGTADTNNCIATIDGKAIGYLGFNDGTNNLKNNRTDIGLFSNLNSTSSLTISGSHISAGTSLMLETDAAESASAAKVYDSSILVKGEEVFRSHDTINNVTFIESVSIAFNGASPTSCTFNGCPQYADSDTLSRPTFNNSANSDGAVLLSASSDITDATFSTETPADYAIEIPAAGDYTLTGYSYTGFTKDINVSATTGTVNINVSGGDTPTFDTAGATVNITKNATITAANLIDDTRVQLWNATKAAELDNSVVSGGGGYSFTANLLDASIDADDIIDLMATYVNGVTAKTELKASGIMTASGLSFIDTQEDSAIYNANAKDGSLVTGITLDVPNVEFDLDEADNQLSAQEIYAWYMNEATTEDGIRNIFREIIPDSQYRYAVKDELQFDNKDLVNSLVITDGYFYRTDGTAVIAANSGNIEMVPDESYVANSDAIQTILNRLDGLIEDSSGDRFTAKALEEAPSGGGGLADWTTAEKEQIRDAIGVDGTKTTATGGQLQNKSEFDHTVDQVITDSGSRTASQATGFATPENVTAAQTAINNNTDARATELRANQVQINEGVKNNAALNPAPYTTDVPNT